MTMTELLPPEILESPDEHGTASGTPANQTGLSRPVCGCMLAAFGRCPTQSGSVDRAR